jgi:hypothetical protein
MKPETILAAFPLLYTLDPRLSDEKARSSYAMKHDFEHLYDEYCSNENLKDALRETVPFLRGHPNTYGEVNLFFSVKPKFELFWLRSKPTERPKGARKAHWEAYLAALDWAKTHPASPAAATVTG